jgi:tetratricopeptide (TPR) repeat protein
MALEPPAEINEKIQQLYNESVIRYENGDLAGIIEVLEQAWRLLPLPREQCSESFHIAYGLASTAMDMGDLDKARMWSKYVFTCDPERAEVGERDFLAGQVAFAASDWDLARKHFLLASKYSEGRCFEGEDRKYRDFLLGKYDPDLEARADSTPGNSSWTVPEEDEVVVDGEELSRDLHARVQTLAARGDAALEEEKFSKAISHYRAALDLLPDPKSRWEASTWLFTAVGDALFFNRCYDQAKAEFYNAANCPGGIHNPFVLLRLGQCLYECGDMANAKESLLRAYMGDGMQVFEGEDDKYFDLIRELV